MEVREEVRQLAQPLAEEAGYELVDVEIASDSGRRVLRVRLDKPGGINLRDCQDFSRRLSDCLDMNQTVAGSFRLEVSSPGLDRPLRNDEAVARFNGQKAAVAVHDPRDGRRNFEGVLIGPEDGRFGVRADDGAEHWFEWAEVKSARLVVDPWAAIKGADKAPKGGRKNRGNGPRP